MTVKKTKVATVPFSASPIWTLQRRYFEEQGIRAWQQSEVPHYITSNPAVARAYANLLFGFFRDRQRIAAGCSDTIYILELGAGSGRLAFHLLKCLDELCADAAFELPSFCYVLSDFTRANLDFWRQQEVLRPYLTAGRLDFACFDAEKDESLYLEHAGRSIQTGQLEQPLVIIGNYFFDSIPQDLFYIREQQLFLMELSLQGDFPDGTPPGEQLQQLEMNYHYKAVPWTYYPEAEFNTLLGNYRYAMDDAYLFFPHAGIRCLERLKRLSSAGFLLLSADKGDERLEEQACTELPEPVLHGSFSLLVNYHAISEYYKAQNAAVYFHGHRHHSLNIACIVACAESRAYAETRMAFRQQVENFGPDDFFRMKKHFERHIGSMQAWQLEGYVRLSGYDARFFKQCVPHLLQLLSRNHVSAAEKENLRLLVAKVAEWYYPIGESQDLAFDMGLLMHCLEQPEAAIAFFESSIKRYAAGAPVFYNLAACYYALEDDPEARKLLLKALELEAGHAAALELLGQLEKPL